jgi:thiamine biosynthesis lipoprotein ApbE
VPRLTPAPEQPSAVAGALGDNGWSQLSLEVLGTYAFLAVRGGGPGLLIDARQLLDDYDRKWNPTRPESLIAQVEAAGGAAVPVDDETFHLVQASVEAASLTDGAVGSEGLDLNAVLARVGAPEGAVFDVDDQARATVADRVAEALVDAGALGAVVDVGGALRLAGTVAEGSAWVIDVADPDADPDDPPVVRLGIAEGAAATVEHPTSELASVTVLADEAATAVVWAAAGDVDAVEASGHPALVRPVEGEPQLLNGIDAFLR